MTETEALEIARVLSDELWEKYGSDPVALARGIKAARDADPVVNEAVKRVGYLADAAKTNQSH